MGISDMIAAFIREELEDTDGVLELQRNDLAQRFHCVPSQINYVMSTRFSPEHGYIVESRRGGGGYIRISRVRVDRPTLLMHFINSIGSEIDGQSAMAIVQNLYETESITQETAELLQIVLGDAALRSVPRLARDMLRADLMRQVLIHCV
ncbi:MAG: CtsR family transcriptional regulator [Eubacteriales bacterium]|nr:CtsR family transcriptional regulator [Eubacteriales bacterium]